MPYMGSNICLKIVIGDGVPDLRLRSSWFEPRQKHCVVSLSKTIYPPCLVEMSQNDKKLLTET